MSTQHQETLKAINEMKTGPIGETVPTHEHDQNSSGMGEAKAKPADRRNPVGGELIERKFQRRNNINSLPGLIREHARLIALIRNGEISLEKGEVLSRAYSRHREMVSALEQRTELAAIREQLQALRGNASSQLLIDEDREAGK